LLKNSIFDSKNSAWNKVAIFPGVLFFQALARMPAAKFYQIIEGEVKKGQGDFNYVQW